VSSGVRVPHVLALIWIAHSTLHSEANVACAAKKAVLSPKKKSFPPIDDMPPLH
jgi:hypothetical protein